MMSDNDRCYCCHCEDEHERNKCGQPAECGVEGCDCIQYERDEEEDE